MLRVGKTFARRSAINAVHTGKAEHVVKLPSTISVYPTPTLFGGPPSSQRLGGKCQSSCSSVHAPVPPLLPRAGFPPQPTLVLHHRLRAGGLHRPHPCPAGAATGGAQGRRQTRSGGERLSCGLAHVTLLGRGVFSLVQRPPHPHPTPQLSPGPGHPLPTRPAHPAAPSRYPWRAWTLGRNRGTGPRLFHPLSWNVQAISAHALPPPALWLGGGQ